VDTEPAAPDLRPSPTVKDWLHRLDRTGIADLSSFSAMELAAVGAGSPIRGLVADDTFMDLDDQRVGDGLARALHGLHERGLAGPPVPSDEQPGTTRIQLHGDLAGIVAVRRSPALVATVAAAPPATFRRPGGDVDAAAVLAVLHGVASNRLGLFATLEETTTGPGTHLFSLCTPAAQADRIFAAWKELDADGPAAVSVQVFTPDPDRPRRTQLVIQAGVVRVSSDGANWQRSAPADQWPALFQSALGL
jgi:hypothetical protein